MRGRGSRALLVVALALFACKSRQAAPGPAPAPGSAPAAPPAAPAATGVPAAEGSAAPAAPQATGNFVELARRLNPAVVSIKTSSRRGVDPFAPLFGGRGGEEDEDSLASLGSGVIIDPEGWVITNDHVVESGEDVHVTLSDGRDTVARIVGRDAEIDVALLKIDLPNLAAAKLGDSDLLEVGEWVLVIGNPFGLENTVTAGIVSAVGRTFRDVPVGRRSVYQSFIQTDASINPGNSGGPLINTAGQVVGIATAIEAPGGGIGFAIPANLIRDLVPRLQSDGRLVRSWLGVYLHPITSELAEQLGLPARRGVFVSGIVDGSPAARAGVAKGDVILQLDGRPVDEKTLPWRTAVSPPGKTIDLVVWRDKAEKHIPVTLQKLPE